MNRLVEWGWTQGDLTWSHLVLLESSSTSSCNESKPCTPLVLFYKRYEVNDRWNAEVKKERCKTESTTEKVSRLLKPSLKSEGLSRLPACSLFSSEAFLSVWHQIHFHFSSHQYFVHCCHQREAIGPTTWTSLLFYRKQLTIKQSSLTHGRNVGLIS